MPWQALAASTLLEYVVLLYDPANESQITNVKLIQGSLKPKMVTLPNCSTPNLGSSHAAKPCPTYQIVCCAPNLRSGSRFESPESIRAGGLNKCLCQPPCVVIVFLPCPFGPFLRSIGKIVHTQWETICSKACCGYYGEMKRGKQQTTHILIVTNYIKKY